MTATSSAPNQSNLLTPHTFQPASNAPSLAYRFRLTGLIDKSLSVLRILHRYSYGEALADAFYNDIMNRNETLKSGDLLLNYLAQFNDIPVGALCAKLRDTGDSQDLVILDLCVLPAYRKLGIARQTMQEIRALCEKHSGTKRIGRIVMEEEKCGMEESDKEAFLRAVGFEKVGETWQMELGKKE